MLQSHDPQEKQISGGVLNQLGLSRSTVARHEPEHHRSRSEHARHALPS
jgi:hypothetical protein